MPPRTLSKRRLKILQKIRAKKTDGVHRESPLEEQYEKNTAIL